MNFLSDLHTHSIVSGHGYSTLLENINYCKENGIKILGTSEHILRCLVLPTDGTFTTFKISQES